MRLLWLYSLPRNIQKCARILHGSETMIYREKERSRIKDVQMDSFRGLLGVRRLDRIPNVQMREICVVTK